MQILREVHGRGEERAKARADTKSLTEIFTQLQYPRQIVFPRNLIISISLNQGIYKLSVARIKIDFDFTPIIIKGLSEISNPRLSQETNHVTYLPLNPLWWETGYLPWRRCLRDSLASALEKKGLVSHCRCPRHQEFVRVSTRHR